MHKWFSSLIGVVEFCSICQHPTIVKFYFVRSLWVYCIRACFYHFILQAAWKFYNAWLLCILIKELLPFDLCTFSLFRFNLAQIGLNNPIALHFVEQRLTCRI